jgi:acyl dehydratase
MMSPTSEVLGLRRFTMEDQHRFASLSGDYNEIHLDPVAARRTMAGEPVVHGLHTVLWALDSYLSHVPDGVVEISATFRKPVLLGEEVELRLGDEDETEATLMIFRGDTRLVDLRLRLGDLYRTSGPDDRGDLELPKEPLDLTVGDLADRSGILEIPLERGELLTGFGALVGALGPVIATQLAAVSRLVGMICPGRHSLLSQLSLSLNHHGSASRLRWRVDSVDDRVGAVSMSLTGGRAEGSVNAFVRPRPAAQPKVEHLSGMIEPGSLDNQRALVIGGSRGLGELTAKLLATGGADVAITWLHGESDAKEVVDDIRQHGGSATGTRLDVSDPEDDIHDLCADGWLPSHVYYFATPQIFIRRTALFDHAAFGRFADIYVGGFARVIDACRREGAPHITAFYPSSVAVTENMESLAEYSAAKAGGEVAARILGLSHAWLSVAVARLPRLPTDQTATIWPIASKDPLMVMSKVVNLVASMSETTGYTLFEIDDLSE